MMSLWSMVESEGLALAKQHLLTSLLILYALPLAVSSNHWYLMRHPVEIADKISVCHLFHPTM